MSRPRLLITRALPQPVLDEAARRFELKLWPHDEPIGAQFDHWSENCDAVWVMATDRLDKARLQRLTPRTRAIATYSVGHDHIDLAAATDLRLPVFHTPDVLSDAVAETAILLILSAARQASQAEALLRSGAWGPWSPTRFLGRQLTGRSLGIFGLGRIGRALAERAGAFGMQIHYHNRSPAQGTHSGWRYHATLESLMAVSEVFCVCAPSTAQTRGAVDAHRLALLPAGAIFVNIARGDLVDEDALMQAMECGHLGGAGLDVYRNEPNIDPRFMSLPCTTLLPHIGSATHEAREAMGMMALDALTAWLMHGRPPANCLNPSCLQGQGVP